MHGHEQASSSPSDSTRQCIRPSPQPATSRVSDDRQSPLLSPASAPSDEPSLLQRMVALFAGTVDEEWIQCQVCLEQIPSSQTIALRACSHQFCADCLSSYLEVKIRDGQVHPTCFYHDAVKRNPSDPVQVVACGVPIDDEDVHELVSEATRRKFHRFRFLQENRFARDCPYCHQMQRCRGPDHPECRCVECGRTFCFLHANAHENQSCAAYERDQATVDHASRTVINRIAKECPKCKTLIEKDGGCNHVRCSRCWTNFCWMCGTIVDDTELPSHFQWWNLGGCAGLLRAEIRQETKCQRIFAKILSVLNFVFIGPASFLLTVVMTILTLGCLPCVCFGHMALSEAFVLGMDLMGWILLLPISLTAALIAKIRQWLRKETPQTSQEPQAEMDPIDVV